VSKRAAFWWLLNPSAARKISFPIPFPFIETEQGPFPGLFCRDRSDRDGAAGPADARALSRAFAWRTRLRHDTVHKSAQKAVRGKFLSHVPIPRP
jgi:hypothetical protein